MRVLQLCSTYPNVGDCCAVLGVQRLLGFAPTLAGMRGTLPDINRNYDCVIIGGGGLLSRWFQGAWQQLATGCTVPVVLWSIGCNFPDRLSQFGVDARLVYKVLANSGPASLRDDITAWCYGITGVPILPCPSVVEMAHLRSVDNDGRVMFVASEATSPARIAETERILSLLPSDHRFSDHTEVGADRASDARAFVRVNHSRSRLIVTTRLHGAVFAYGLGIPYILLARGEQMRAFHRLYGNGVCVSTPEDITRYLDAEIPVDRPIRLDGMLQFGARVGEWLKSI